MQHTEAEQIYKEYDAVLNSEKKKYGMVFPSKLLPYPEAIIKEAIKVFATWLKVEKKLGLEIMDRLRLAYTSLGIFVSQEEADFIKRYQESLPTAGDAGFAGQTKKFQFITNKVRNREEDRMQEARTFFSRLRHDKPLAEHL
ncbi:MAG: hypothetical protein HYY50_04720 [Candidatus Kerfeldbacteria bacterium]|nr:hypothetical protein [Candidatus Kerfeldbacteria bacterium]